MPTERTHAYISYAALDIPASLAALHVTQSQGHTAHEVLELQSSYGMNALTSTELRWWNIFARQFRSSFVYLLIAAAGLSLFLGEPLDGGMIALFVLVNAGLGFFQEYRSEQTLKLLQNYVASSVRVRRDGKETAISSRELVPGDIVLLQSGDSVPADLRLLSEHNCSVDESPLTGESVHVSKEVRAASTVPTQPYEAKNILFSGSTIVTGIAEGAVIATGNKTVMGDVTRLATSTVRVSGFEKGIATFSTFILRLILITLCAVFLANVFMKQGNTSIVELLIFSIALAVSVIPEALPVVTAFSLSRGAFRLAKQHVVVKRLSAIEDLGGIDVLCTDKTGTITENRMEVSEIQGVDPSRVLQYAALGAGSATSHDPFDVAIDQRLGAQDRVAMQGFRIVNQVPFDPVRKKNSVLVTSSHGSILIVRGAPETILHACHLSSDEAASLDAWMAEQGIHGCRVLAVAYKQSPIAEQYAIAEEDTGLTLLGIIAFRDPVKSTAPQAIARARSLGVDIKILTGDRREVAGAVAAEVGLIRDANEVITGEELESMSDDDQHKAVAAYHVFARVSPQQKHRIIHLLQHEHTVGFLGEGINDAPALRIANVGIVVQHASGIAREAADIVLLKKSLNVIVEGIHEGRSVFANTIKYIKSTLASNFGNFFAISIASLLIDTLPMLPLQILLVNLLSDFPLIAVATDTVDPEEVQRPRGYHVRDIALLAVALGVVSTVFDFIFFAIFSRMGAPMLHTGWFVGSVLTELAFIYSIRTSRFFLRGALPSKPLLVLTGIAAICTVGAVLIPSVRGMFGFTALNGSQFTLIGVIVVSYFIVTELVKMGYYRMRG
jgi:P-type Mg2+ transporter